MGGTGIESAAGGVVLGCGMFVVDATGVSKGEVSGKCLGSVRTRSGYGHDTSGFINQLDLAPITSQIGFEWGHFLRVETSEAYFHDPYNGPQGILVSQFCPASGEFK